MNKTILALSGFLALAMVLVACSKSDDDTTIENATTQKADATSATTAGAELNSGIDLDAIDHSVNPGDAFYKYANGDWLKTTEIPADRSSTGAFLVAYKRAQERTADLIKDAAKSSPPEGSLKSKIADYYTAYMNTDAIESLGLKPIEAQLSTIKAIESREDLARVLGERLSQDVDPLNYTDYHTSNLFGLFVAQGLTDPTHNIAYLLQGGLVMPSRAYYLTDSDTMADFREKYKAYITELLKAAGTTNAEAKAERVFDLEMKIAEAQATLVESQNIHEANNLWTPAEFGEKAPGLDWHTYLQAAGLAGQEVIDVWQPEAFTKLSRLTQNVPLESWKALLRFHTLDQAAALLPEKFAKLHFEFHQHTLSGVPQQRERWKRAVAATSNALGMAVGKLYVDKYFPASAKHDVQAMVDNIIAAFGARLDTLDWMTPETREKARAKLDSITVAVGYPEQWPSYEGLNVNDDNPLLNAINAGKYQTQQRMAMLGKPVNNDHWWMTPQLVNAINLPLQNQLQFPAGILQPPFFVADADPARNYGAIGAVIGHEISHSFDNLGSQFDAQGRLHNWWTPTDKQHFEAASQALVEQYGQYEPLPGLHINGQQTLGENIADVAGLTAAYLAYQKSLNDKPAPVIDGLTGDQRFFLAFAQTWRSKIRDEALRQRIKTNVHAPGRYRALTVRNLDAWYKAFDVKPGGELYLAPEERVQIW